MNERRESRAEIPDVVDKIDPYRSDHEIGVQAQGVVDSLVRKAGPVRLVPTQGHATGPNTFDKGHILSESPSTATYVVEHVKLGRDESRPPDADYGRSVTIDETTVARDLEGKPLGSVAITHVELDASREEAASRGLTYTPANNGSGPELDVQVNGIPVMGDDRVAAILQLNDDLSGFANGVQALVGSAPGGRPTV